MRTLKQRVAAVATDERAQWGIFAVLTGFAVVACSVFLTDVAGLRRRDVGLSALWRPAAVKARIDGALRDVLSERRLAAALANSDVLKPVVPQNDSVFKPWTACSAIAAALTSDAAREALAVRLANLARANEKNLVEVWTGLRKQPPSRPPPDLVKSGEAAATCEIDAWFDEMLPRAALDSIVTDAGGSAASEEIRDAIGRHVTTFISPAAMGSRLIESAEQQFRVGAQDDDIVQAASKDFAGRQAWAVASVVFTTVALVAIIGGIARVRALTATAAAGAWGFVVVAAAVAGYVATRVPNLGNPFLSEAVKYFDALYDLRLEEYSHVINGLAAAAVIVLVASSWASFLPRERHTARLRLQLESLKWSINTATLLLVVGVIEVYALLHWPSAFASEAAASAIRTGATSAAGAAGVTFSLILLLIYVPGSRMLRERVRAEIAVSKGLEAEEDRPQSERTEAAARQSDLKEMLEANGFTTTTGDLVTRFGQALLPLLASGTVPQLFSMLGTG